MYLLDGKLPGNRAAGAVCRVSLDELLLNFELFLGKLEYAFLVNLISDLAEKVGDMICGCRGP